MSAALWKRLNEEGTYDIDGNGSRPWGFIWGSPLLEDIRKCCATIMSSAVVDIWLHQSGDPYWGRRTPMDFIEEGAHDEVYMAIYKIGNGIGGVKCSL